MLLELAVENYAVVEKARVRFHRGLNLLTGETGSGKSIVVDALALLLGGRASADLVRAGAERARVSGIFELPEDPGLAELLASGGVEAEDGELVLEREVLANGKSRAFAGGRAVTAAWLRDAAPSLGDIHGQNDQQRLFSGAVQLAMLDEFAGSAELLLRVGNIFHQWKRCSEELAALEVAEREQLRLADLWRFQLKEIEAAALKPEEDAELENEKRVLKNVARLQENAAGAYAALYDAPQSALSQVGAALKRMEDLCKIDESLRPVIEALRAAAIGLQEAAGTLASYLDKLEADPGRLDAVESRLETIAGLKRKYGASIEDILAFLDGARARMAAVECSAERRVALEKQRMDAEREYRDWSGRLSEKRRGAASRLAEAVEKELGALAFGNTAFQIAVAETPWSERGTDRVEFLVSPNAGEEPRPLNSAASGGELSRIALALKTCAEGRSEPAGVPRTLVFDEVDAGIGGGVAETVGRRLKRLAQTNQVLCVTHLPQVASFADHHFAVTKRETGGRTVAEVEELLGEARVREIGRMLSGRKVTEEALKHAGQMIRASTAG